MTVQLEYFVKLCVLLKYLNEVLYINVWASIVRIFQLSEHTQVLMGSDKQVSIVYVHLHVCAYINKI